MSYLRESYIRLADSPSSDAFGRLRVSEPAGLFSSQLQYDTSPLLWADSITAATETPTVTHLPNEATARLRLPAGTTVGGIAQRQTRQYVRYQPGKSQLIFITSVPLVGATAGVKREIGLFDANNGILLRFTAAAPSLVRRTYVTGSAVETVVAQASWNIDPMTGSGPSGITLDFTKSQILGIDLEWLGVGRVRVGFVVDGVFWPVHQFLNTNSLATVYMTTANLPITYRIEATDTTAAIADLHQICSMVASEGGFDSDRGYHFSASNVITGVTVNNTDAVVLALHVDPNCPAGGSIANQATAYMESVSVFAASADNIYWKLIYGATLDNTGWADVNGTYSGMRVSSTAVYTGSSGIIVEEGYVTASNQNKSVISREVSARLPLVRNGFGTVNSVSPVGNVVLVARNLAAANASVLGVLGWTELY